MGRRTARAILIDDDGCLVLIRRTRPGQAPYWTSPGGGVEGDDDSVEAALRRELAEELGAVITHVSPVTALNAVSDDMGRGIEHYFVARLVRTDESQRTGPEYTDESRGGYELDRISLHGDTLHDIDLLPAALKEFILANRRALLVVVGLDQE